jgi:hypothetical protein
MAQFTGTAELDGLFKIVYPDDYIKTIPSQGLFSKMIPFDRMDKTGKAYNVQAVLAYSHGFTYNTTSGSAYSLNNQIAMSSDEATIAGSEITLRDAISMRAMSQAAGGNRQAFKNATEQVVDNMLDSMTKRLELSMLYGQSGIATADDSTNVSATSTDVLMTAGSYSGGIWAGMENAEFQFYNGTSTVAAGAVFTCTSINNDSRIVRFTSTATAISQLDTLLNSTNLSVFFRGSYGEEMLGIQKIMTQSGSLFGINHSTYALWKANEYSAGSAQLTFSKVLQGAARAYNRGLVGKSVLVCNPITWQNLSNDLAALRRYDGSYKRTESALGTEAITYFGQTGEISVVGYNLVKPGDAFLLPIDEVKRIGSSDITFNVPGMGDRIFFVLPDRNGVELRNYCDQAIFINKPATSVYFKDIVNVAP